MTSDSAFPFCCEKAGLGHGIGLGKVKSRARARARARARSRSVFDFPVPVPEPVPEPGFWAGAELNAETKIANQRHVVANVANVLFVIDEDVAHGLLHVRV